MSKPEEIIENYRIHDSLVLEKRTIFHKRAVGIKPQESIFFSLKDTYNGTRINLGTSYVLSTVAKLMLDLVNNALEFNQMSKSMIDLEI